MAPRTKHKKGSYTVRKTTVKGRGAQRQEFVKGKTYNDRMDRARKAKPPGKRISKNGNVYYEYRRNRTDRKGKRV